MSDEHGSMQQDEGARSEFERRVAALLQDSADGLDGHTRSALTRARHAALAHAPATASTSVVASGLRAWTWRAWAPAGALAAGLLVAVFFVGRQGSLDRPTGGGAADDIALVSDADGYDLSADADMDLDADFYEWAADAASASRGLGS